MANTVDPQDGVAPPDEAAKTRILDVEAASGTPPGRPKALWPLVAAVGLVALVVLITAL